MRRLFNLFKKYQKRNLLIQYNKIKRNNKIFTIDEIKEKIYKKKLVNNQIYNKIFFLKNFDFDLLLRQYLYSNLIYISSNINFVKSLNNKKKIYTIHPKHLKLLTENNIAVNIFLSYLKWYLYSFISLVNSQLYFFKIIIIFFANKKKVDKESAYFCSFPLSKLEENNAKNEFFLNHFIEKFQLTKVYHDNKNLEEYLDYRTVKIIKDVNNIRLFSYLNLVKFIFFNLFFFLLSSILFIFKQDLAIMLKEILKSYLFQIEKKNYSKIFLFNNSDGIYRPMWSYLKKPNLKIYFFFFGGNCMPFENDNLSDVKKFKLYFSSNYYGLQFWSWENYLFWNDFQRISYQKNLINKKISYEMDRCIEVNYKKFFKNYDKNILSFFDITPYDKIFTIKRLASSYHNFKNAYIMFRDVFEICNKLDINIIYKSKRFRENIHDKKYIKFLEKINKFENVSVYDENFSSSSILKNSNLAICSPFTSVGIIAKSLNIKAAYYDLSDIYYKEKIAFENLPIIKNKTFLEEWIKNNINNNEK